MPFVMIMLALEPRDYDAIFQAFVSAVVPSLGHKRVKKKLTDMEFRALEDYMEKTQMLNRIKVAEVFTNFKIP